MDLFADLYRGDGKCLKNRPVDRNLLNENPVRQKDGINNKKACKDRRTVVQAQLFTDDVED